MAMQFRFGLIFILFAFNPSLNAAEQCIPESKWLIPKSGSVQTYNEFINEIDKNGVVLLGEHHANSAHHIWQNQFIKSIHKKQKNIAIGMEMFPRRLQQVLDNWTAGKLSKSEFVGAIDWPRIWSHNFDDYFPIMDYARKNEIRLIALNVDQELLYQVRKVGWNNVPEEQREGVGNPARPSKNYARQLAYSFKKHRPETRTLDKVGFSHFVQQQLLWDRAMAEAIASQKDNNPDQLIVALMGSWHIIDRHGVPHQLKDLAITDVTTLVPWDNHLDCDAINANYADGIFGINYQSKMSLDVSSEFSDNPF